MSTLNKQSVSPEQSPASPKSNLLTRRRFLGLGSVAVAATVLTSGLFVRNVVFSIPDTSEDYGNIEVSKGASYTVAIAAAMLQRELDRGWAPSAILNPFDQVAISKQGFQIGILKGCEGTVQIMRDYIARLRGTSEEDADLKDAFRRLSYPEDQWGVFKANSTVDQLNIGVKSLLRYNERLAAGNAVYDRRSDSLVKYIERDNLDFGAFESHLTDLADEKGIVSLEAQKAYYRGRGLLFSNHNLYKGIKKDYKDILEYFAIGPLFDKTLSVMEDVSAGWGKPRVVLNDAPGDLFASDLELLAGGITRVRTALRELSEAAISKSSAELKRSNAPLLAGKRSGAKAELA